MRNLKGAKPWTEADLATLLQMLGAGETERKIAEALDRTQTAVASRRLMLTREGKWPPN